MAAGFLDVLEGAAGALDLAAGLLPYTALATVVVRGVTSLTGGERALMARRDQFTAVTATYYALIDPTAEVDPESLHVTKENFPARRR